MCWCWHFHWIEVNEMVDTLQNWRFVTYCRVMHANDRKVYECDWISNERWRTFVVNKVASQKWNLAARLISIWQQWERIDRHISFALYNIHTFALLCIDTMKYRFIYMACERSWFGVCTWWEHKMGKQNNQKCFQTMLTAVHFLYANVIFHMAANTNWHRWW